MAAILIGMVTAMASTGGIARINHYCITTEPSLLESDFSYALEALTDRAKFYLECDQNDKIHCVCQLKVLVMWVR